MAWSSERKGRLSVWGWAGWHRALILGHEPPSPGSYATAELYRTLCDVPGISCCYRRSSYGSEELETGLSSFVSSACLIFRRQRPARPAPDTYTPSLVVLDGQADRETLQGRVPPRLLLHLDRRRLPFGRLPGLARHPPPALATALARPTSPATHPAARDKACSGRTPRQLAS